MSCRMSPKGVAAMSEIPTRRDFLRSGVAATLACAVGGSATRASLAAEKADLILFNGRIATQDQRRPTALAVAIKDGKFVAVGDDNDARGAPG